MQDTETRGRGDTVKYQNKSGTGFRRVSASPRLELPAAGPGFRIAPFGRLRTGALEEIIRLTVAFLLKIMPQLWVGARRQRPGQHIELLKVRLQINGRIARFFYGV